MNEPLAERVVIVTGAARGLGRAYVDHLVRRGACVLASDIDADALDAARDEAPAGRVVTCAGDAAAPDVVAAAVELARSTWGHVDAVIANAGLLRSGPILHAQDDDIDAVLAVHVKSPLLFAREVGRYWRAEAKAGRPRPGALVLTTSSAGLYGFRAEAIYSAAKAGVAALTLVAADELGRYGATVNAVAPVARTRLTAWLDAPPADAEADRYAPEHFAPLVGWLVGPDARDVTARVFECGGGSIGIVDGWRPVAHATLPADAAAPRDELFRGLVSEAPPPRGIVVPDPAG